jgi:outer membrane protein TolC
MIVTRALSFGVGLLALASVAPGAPHGAPKSKPVMQDMKMAPAETRKGPVLTLQESLALASGEQPSVAAYEREAGASEQAAIAARSLPDPQLQLGIRDYPVTGENALSPIDNNFTMYMVGIMREQVRRSKREAAAAQLAAEALVSRRQGSERERQIRRDVMIAWINAVEAHQKSLLLQRLADDLHTGHLVMQEGIKTGRATPATVLRMDSEIALAEGAVAEARADEDRGRAEIGRWIGASAAARPLPDSLPLIDAPKAVPADLLQVGAHPSLQLAQAQQEAASRQVEVARQDRKPDITWSVTFEARPRFGNMVTGQVSVPLEINRRNNQDRRIAEAQLRADAAALRAEDTRRDLIRQYETARADFEGADAELMRIDREAVPALESAFNTAEARFESGGGTAEESFQIVQRYLETTVRSVETRGKRDRAVAHMIYIVGGTGQ